MKRNSNHIWIVACAVALLGPMGFSHAAKHKAAPPAKTHTTPYWAIASVDSAANSVVLQKSDNSTNLTLKVSSNTKCTLEGKPCKLAELQTGLKVSYMASGNICSSLDAVAPPAPPEKKKGKKNK